jgi:hypothetical protein
MPVCAGAGFHGYGHGSHQKTPGLPVVFPNSIASKYKMLYDNRNFNVSKLHVKQLGCRLGAVFVALIRFRPLTYTSRLPVVDVLQLVRCGGYEVVMVPPGGGRGGTWTL